MIATAFTTHFLENRKRRKDQKQKFKEVLGESIALSLTNVRNVVVMTKTMEVYTEDSEISTDGANDISAFRDFAWYPAFMNDRETLSEFWEEISSLRSEYEQFLDLMSAAYLYAIDKYLMSLMLYIKKNNLQNYLHLVGCFVIIDIQKWEKRFDIHLVKRINKPYFKLFSRHGVKWNIAKWYVEKTFLKKTQLHQAMQGKLEFPIEEIIAANERKKLKMGE